MQAVLAKVRSFFIRGLAVVAVIATYALGSIGGDRVTSELVELVHDESHHVRLAVADTLRKIWQPHFLDYFVLLLNDRNFEIRTCAAEAISRV